MKTTYKDPLIPTGEDTNATLRRLSANIDTLTTLIGEAERAGQFSLVKMFTRSRATKAAEATDLMASATAPVRRLGKPISLSPAGPDAPSPSLAMAVGAPTVSDMAIPPIDERLFAGPSGEEVETRFLLVGFPPAETDFTHRRSRQQKMLLVLEDEIPPPVFARPASL